MAKAAAQCQLFCGPSVDISETATGGGFNPTRLTAPSKSLGILALGSDLVALYIPALEDFSAVSPDISSGDIETVTYDLPIVTQSLGKASQHDIQTVTHSTGLMCCIDGLGGTYLHRLPTDAPLSSTAKRCRIESSLELDPLGGLPIARSCEFGWAGASFRNDGQVLGVCHGLGRWVGVCDVETRSRVNLGYLSRPCRGIGWFNDNVLAFAESETVALWDVRSEAKSSTFTRCTPAGGTLHCVSGLTDNLVACAGSDRVVYIIDNRTMRVLRHWRSPCKFDITSILPSKCATDVVYLTGLDNEIMTCNIGGSDKNKQKQKRRPKLGTTNSNNVANVVQDVEDVMKKEQGTEEEDVVGGHGRLHQSHSLGVRGDGRWIGVSLCSTDDEEAVLGVCASGTLNVLDNPHLAKHATG